MRPKACETCELEFSPSHSVQKFCSRSCAAKTNNTKRLPRTAESRAKTAATLSAKYVDNPKHRYMRPTIEKVCPTCQITFFGDIGKKYCKAECRNQAFSKRMSAWLKENRSHLSGRSTPSYMERTFATWLEQQGIKLGLHGYLTEVRFYNPTTKRNGWADFVFPSYRLIIELDGSHHRNRIELDQIRDAYLTSRGWKVVRITYREYQLGSRKAEILNLLGLETPGGIEPPVFLPSV